MIGRLTGLLVERGSDGASVIDVRGVGYEVFLAGRSLAEMSGQPATVTVHVHTHVREDALVLYGFSTVEDRAAFRTLLTVSGVGPKVALAIVGALDARELALAVAREDIDSLRAVPGVGKKTAERLILELRDKLGAGGSAPVAVSPGRSGAFAQAEPLARVASALVQMGYKQSEAERAVAQLAAGDVGQKPMESLLREALAGLS